MIPAPSIYASALMQSDPELPGFLYLERVITPTDEALLMADLLARPGWVGVSPSPNSRKVLQFGSRYTYHPGAALGSAPPIPPELIAPLAGLPLPAFDQLLINRYLPGQGIAPHIDDTRAFGPIIACITLGSGCNVAFERGTQRIVRYVAPGSIYVMTGDSRYAWTHSIEPKKTDTLNGRRVARNMRISLTYRTVRAPTATIGPKSDSEHPATVGTHTP